MELPFQCDLSRRSISFFPLLANPGQLAHDRPRAYVEFLRNLVILITLEFPLGNDLQRFVAEGKNERLNRVGETECEIRARLAARD